MLIHRFMKENSLIYLLIRIFHVEKITWVDVLAFCINCVCFFFQLVVWTRLKIGKSDENQRGWLFVYDFLAYNEGKK